MVINKFKWFFYCLNIFLFCFFFSFIAAGCVRLHGIGDISMADGNLNDAHRANQQAKVRWTDCHIVCQMMRPPKWVESHDHPNKSWNFFVFTVNGMKWFASFFCSTLYHSMVCLFFFFFCRAKLHRGDVVRPTQQTFYHLYI